MTADDGQKMVLSADSISWNQIYSRYMVLSAFVAKHRMGYSDKDKVISQDKWVQKEMKQVMQEFLLLSGIDPESMMSVGANQLYKDMVKNTGHK